MELPFLILGLVPIVIIVVWVFSRYICNLLNAPQAIIDLLEPPRKELIEISKTTKGYDPRFKIEDPLQFKD
jgi:hypothetical protein